MLDPIPQQIYMPMHYFKMKKQCYNPPGEVCDDIELQVEFEVLQPYEHAHITYILSSVPHVNVCGTSRP